jgi:hypothetical protein
MPNKSRDQFLDLPEGDPLSTEHLEEKVHLAEQQEHALKRQLEVVEKQKREFEELSRRQETLNAGKAEVVEKLTRALVVLEREALDASKRMEALQMINSSFVQHLQVVEAINPKSWDPLDIGKELMRALASVDDARAEYIKSYPKVCPAPDQQTGGAAGEPAYAGDYSGGDAKDFVGWLKIGLAFSLPLLIFGLIALVVIVSRLPAK